VHCRGRRAVCTRDAEGTHTAKHPSRCNDLAILRSCVRFRGSVCIQHCRLLRQSEQVLNCHVDTRPAQVTRCEDAQDINTAERKREYANYRSGILRRYILSYSPTLQSSTFLLLVLSTPHPASFLSFAVYTHCPSSKVLLCCCIYMPRYAASSRP